MTMTPAHLIALMTRSKIPMYWGRHKVTRALNPVTLQPEEKLSIEVADWLREMTLTGQLKGTWTHIPNEGKRSKLTAIVMAAMGMIPGASDFVFLWGNGSGCIELKAGKNTQSPMQKSYQAWCHDSHVPYAVCRNLEEAQAVIKGWGIV